MSERCHRPKTRYACGLTGVRQPPAQRRFGANNHQIRFDFGKKSNQRFVAHVAGMVRSHFRRARVAGDAMQRGYSRRSLQREAQGVFTSPAAHDNNRSVVHAPSCSPTMNNPFVYAICG